MDPLERWLDDLHRKQYEPEGRAVIFKVPTPGEPTKTGGYSKRPAVWLDFTGVLAQGGLSLNLEAKLCGLTRKGEPSEPDHFPLKMLRPIQVDRFGQLARMPGPMAALYIRHNTSPIHTDDYLVPPGWHEERRGLVSRRHLVWPGKHTKYNYILWGELEKWRIPQGHTWLDAVSLRGKFNWPRYKNEGWEALI